MDIPLPFQIIDLDVQSNYSNDAAELPEVLSEQKEAQHFNYIWSKHPLYNNDTRFCGELPKEFLPLPSLPITYLKKKITNPMLQHIATQSNLYYVQQKGERQFKPIDLNDIERYMGVLIINGYLKYPSLRMHWRQSTRTPLIADNIRRDFFDYINSCLHFNDNTLTPARDSVDYNKLYKVQPILDYFSESLRIIDCQSELSVDEQLIPTRGRSVFRQYLPNKPFKWGIKVWALCSQNGILHRFMIYQGKGNEKRQFGVGESVVLKLTEEIPENKNYTVGFDNYFTSLRLLCILR
jgi:hypothetical protein